MHQPIETNRSVVVIKPDAVAFKLVGVILSHFEKPFDIECIEQRQMTRDFCKLHYAEHIAKDFYPGLEDFMVSAPVVALGVAGDVEDIRSVALEIRRLWKRQVHGPRNLVHASDSEDSAVREMFLWFG